MGFAKFGLDDQQCDEDVEVSEEIVSAKRKRKSSCSKECARKSRPKTAVDKVKRKPKDVDYNEVKDDLNNLLYISQIAQIRVPHSLFPNLNVGLNSCVDVMDLPKNIYPDCTFAEPRPIYYAKNHCESIDPCFRRTISNENYRKRMSAIRTLYQSAWKKSRQLRKFSKESVYNNLLFTIAERLERNPDPFFHGNYDFYYTGGNLCTLSKADSHNVLHVENTKIASLKLSTYPMDQFNESTALIENISSEFPNDTEIFEVAPLYSMKNEQDLVAARQMNSITILRINPFKNTMKKLIEFHSKSAPLISFAQSAEMPELLVVTTMKQSLRLYNISRPKRVILRNTFKVQEESTSGIVSYWNCIKRWHGKTFLYANEHQLMFADFRAPKKGWLKSECTFSSTEFPCEYNTSLAVSEFKNLFYMGTTHKLRCLDARYLKPQTLYEQCTVCEWTHQLDYPPSFLDVFHDVSREYVACASQIAGDLRICELTKSRNLELPSECAFESHCLPWQPPTVQEAYDSASLAGKVLNPVTGLKQRVRACTTGLKFLKFDNNPDAQALLLYSNSCGVVFAQTMKRRQEGVLKKRITAQSSEIMEEFNKNLLNLEQPPLNYTDTVDMKAMRSILLCPQLNRKNVKQEKDDANTQPCEDLKTFNFKRSKGRWRKSMATLHTYKDALVPDLLSIWDIPCEDETDLKYSELQNAFKEEKTEKDILCWLNESEKIAPTTTIPISNLNLTPMDIDMTGIEDQPQSTQVLGIGDFDGTFLGSNSLVAESPLNNSARIVPAKAKAAKSKKKHVKGF